ncbi:MAG TPA: hypothetical protein VKE98_04360 [Gemmataceae bacterium]|nr:hypothetical protein [Gemmataceae bacterium]
MKIDRNGSMPKKLEFDGVAGYTAYARFIGSKVGKLAGNVPVFAKKAPPSEAAEKSLSSSSSCANYPDIRNNLKTG